MAAKLLENLDIHKFPPKSCYICKTVKSEVPYVIWRHFPAEAVCDDCKRKRKHNANEDLNPSTLTPLNSISSPSTQADDFLLGIEDIGLYLSPGSPLDAGADAIVCYYPNSSINSARCLPRIANHIQNTVSLSVKAELQAKTAPNHLLKEGEAIETSAGDLARMGVKYLYHVWVAEIESTLQLQRDLLALKISIKGIIQAIIQNPAVNVIALPSFDISSRVSSEKSTIYTSFLKHLAKVLYKQVYESSGHRKLTVIVCGDDGQFTRLMDSFEATRRFVDGWRERREPRPTQVSQTLINVPLASPSAPSFPSSSSQPLTPSTKYIDLSYSLQSPAHHQQLTRGSHATGDPTFSAHLHFPTPSYTVDPSTSYAGSPTPYIFGPPFSASERLPVSTSDPTERGSPKNHHHAPSSSIRQPVDDQRDLLPFHSPQVHPSHELPSYSLSAEEIEKRELKEGQNLFPTPLLPSTPSSILGVTNSMSEEATGAICGSGSDYRQGTERTLDSFPQVLIDFSTNLTPSADQSSLITSCFKCSGASADIQDKQPTGRAVLISSLDSCSFDAQPSLNHITTPVFGTSYLQELYQAELVGSLASTSRKAGPQLGPSSLGPPRVMEARLSTELVDQLIDELVAPTAPESALPEEATGCSSVPTEEQDHPVSPTSKLSPHQSDHLSPALETHMITVPPHGMLPVPESPNAADSFQLEIASFPPSNETSCFGKPVGILSNSAVRSYSPRFVSTHHDGTTSFAARVHRSSAIIESSSPSTHEPRTSSSAI